MRGKINLKEAAIIVANVRPELKPCEKLLIKVALHPSVVKKSSWHMKDTRMYQLVS